MTSKMNTFLNETAEVAWARFLSQSGLPASNTDLSENITSLVALADGPFDACKVILDLLAAKVHANARDQARVRGEPVPQPPAPVSKLLTGFAAIIRGKLLTIASLLDPNELGRLVNVVPGMMASLDANNPDLVTLVAELLRAEDTAVGGWLHDHLDAIERRFAS